MPCKQSPAPRTRVYGPVQRQVESDPWAGAYGLGSLLRAGRPDGRQRRRGSASRVRATLLGPCELNRKRMDAGWVGGAKLQAGGGRLGGTARGTVGAKKMGRRGAGYLVDPPEGEGALNLSKPLGRPVWARSCGRHDGRGGMRTRRQSESGARLHGCEERNSLPA
jgi:hypothetical protein